MDSMYPSIGPEIAGVASAVDQISNICDRYEQKLRETENALTMVLREYATWVIEAWHVYQSPLEHHPLASPGFEITDPHALAFVQRYLHHHVGICEGCGRKAPLIALDNAFCAWGCSPRSPQSIAPLR